MVMQLDKKGMKALMEGGVGVTAGAGREDEENGRLISGKRWL